MSPRPPLLQRPPVIKHSHVYKPEIGSQLTLLLLIFNTSCLFSASAIVCEGCPVVTFPGTEQCESSQESASTHRGNLQRVTTPSSLGNCFLQWYRWVPSQLMSLCQREEGCIQKKRELKDRSSSAGPLRIHHLHLSTWKASSFSRMCWPS